MAVLLDNIMERLEKLEKQVNNATITRQQLEQQLDVVSKVTFVIQSICAINKKAKGLMT